METLRREVALKNAHIETLCNDNAASNETILAINQHSKALSQKIRELEFEIEQVISASKTVEVTLEPARSDAATELANAEQRLRDNEDEKDSLNNTLFETKKEWNLLAGEFMSKRSDKNDPSHSVSVHLEVS
ncbi:unnamed protein product [Toxocara canis]|uniref:Uncharacterized protein n=1 Tax=Toxocara canis TaxID=6265 RepID=A0A3P7FKH3_TOXCA|nr:unnamed protein product [Toxocara canis]